MPKRKRKQREHTEDWQTIQQYTLWPEQTAYELLCPKSRPEKNRSASHLVAHIVKILSKNEEFFVAVL